MKIRTDIFVIVVILLFAACTSTRRTEKTAENAVAEEKLSIPAPDENYTPAQITTYYYLQGIRAQGIYNDKSAARACFTAALKHDSLHAPSYHALSGTFYPDDPEKAIAYSKRATELDPENIWYKQELGQLYIVAGRYESARKVYDEIIRLAPNNPENYRYLAALYDGTGLPYAALTLLDSAEVRFGFVEELSAYKRQLLVETGLIDRAIAETQILTQNSPYNEEHFVILGDLYAGTGKDSLAIEAYQQALAVAPNSIQALVSLSDFYHERGDMTHFLATVKQIFASDGLPLENKIKFFNETIKNPQVYQKNFFAVNDLVNTLAVKYPGDFEVAQLYALHQISIGDVEGAAGTYKSMLSDTSGIETYKTIIEIEAYLERNDSVNRYTELALEHYPGEIEFYFTKGYGEYHMKAYGEALETFGEALRYAPTDSLKSAIFSSMGQIEQTRDSLSGGYVKYFVNALKYDPENLHAMFNYSEYLVNTGGNPEKALKNLQNDSLRSLMLGTIGDMYHADSLSKPDEAYKYYEKALKYDPKNIHVLNNYSYYLSLEERELEKALDMSARVIELEPSDPTYLDTYGWI
ncbi:tetratricopeptide repeat protein, partial [Alistipes sp. OttesenSCG-928-L06]|nr:tetratricopeptide repeat protein [Alistipes sp. OttesenSCG-928-L06]